MSKPLRLLAVEDSEAETAPLVRELRRHGYEPEAVRVDASAASGADRFIPKNCLRDELPGALAQLFPGHAGGAEEEQP